MTTQITDVTQRSVRFIIDGESRSSTWDDLRGPAQQDDVALATAYRGILAVADFKAVCLARDAAGKSVAACKGHIVARTATRAYVEMVTFASTTAANQRENPAAHGNITDHDTCACGAVRQTNVNQQHLEVGDWLVPHIADIRDAMSWLPA